MAAITDISDILNRLTGGNSGSPEHIFFFKDGRVGAGAAAPTVAGRFTSLWEYNGAPSHGVAPTTVAVPTNDTAGGMRQTDPGGGRQKWLLGITAMSTQLGTLVLYDRLLHIGSLDGTVATAQSVGGTLDRYTGSESIGNQIWIEITTQIGSSATTITASYTNQDGNPATTVATPIGGTGLREAQRQIVLPLASGDTGVRGVTSVTLNATTGTAGNFEVLIVRPLLFLPMAVTCNGAVKDLISGFPALIEVKTDACLAMSWLANTTTVPIIYGSIHMVEK